MSATPVRYHLGKFPPTNLDWADLIPLIGPANASLARYDGLLSAIPNAHILLSPLTTQEAVLSSKIEGTHVTIGEVLEIEAGGDGDSRISQPKRDDAEEVINYRSAMRACMTEVEAGRTLSQHILRAAHARLMKGVRGRDKTPGQYRTEQNWIGPPKCKLEQATFIPVSIAHLQSGMDEWERYVGSTKEPDVLVQLAIIHVEFEALHPFTDGNGRIGRMLIPLFLAQRKLLSSPDFYMSGYLEANRDEYVERLREVSRNANWTQWCAFFLRGVRQQAAENEEKARAILKLYDRLVAEVVELTHSQHSSRAVDFIFSTPIFTAPTFTNLSKIPKPTAARILDLMRGKGILSTLREGRGRRAGVYAFRELVNLAEGKKVL
jgi:Fic family protein